GTLDRDEEIHAGLLRKRFLRPRTYITNIVGTGVPDCPSENPNQTPWGQIAPRFIPDPEHTPKPTQKAEPAFFT
ncbi:MAG: hypothetical protein IJ497_08475, partial [Clostridia bacterium]|nr:hypothetical protein [Clostridia bacterium]